MTSNTSPITTAREALTPLATIQQELETLALFAAPGYGNEARRQAMILTGRFASILELAEKLKSALEVTQDEGLTEIARLEADVEKLKAERDAWERRAVSAISLANKKDEDITRLTSQLEQAERVITPFGKFGASYADGKYQHQHGEVFHIWPATGPAIITVENLKSAAQWIKDRQAKGEG